MRKYGKCSHIKLYISDTGREPLREFFNAIAMRQEYEYAGLGKSDSTGATLIRCCNGFTDIVVIVVVLAEDDDVLADPLLTVIGMRPAVKLPPMEPVDGDECDEDEDEDDDGDGEPIELLVFCMSGE